MKKGDLRLSTSDCHQAVRIGCVIRFGRLPHLCSASIVVGQSRLWTIDWISSGIFGAIFSSDTILLFYSYRVIRYLLIVDYYK